MTILDVIGGMVLGAATVIACDELAYAMAVRATSRRRKLRRQVQIERPSSLPGWRW